MGITKKTNLVIPQVMSDYINAKLINDVKFMPLAMVNTDLQNGAGDTISLPTYSYIGVADDVAEGVDVTPALLSASTVTKTVKKACKSVQISDEAKMSAFRNPIAEAESQLATSLVDKVEVDCLATLATIAESMTADYTTADESGYTQGRTASAISKTLISSVVTEFFGEDLDEEIYLFVSPAQYHTLRTDDAWETIANGEKVVSGQVGKIYGVNIVVTNRIALDESGTNDFYVNYFVKEGGLGIALKRDTQVETDRNITNKTEVISVDKHYVTYIHNASKLIKLFVNP